jgi:hypothetical protein
VLSIEGSELGRIVGWEATSRRILRIVEPKSQVKGIGRFECRIRIEPENLIEQDGLDTNMAIVASPVDLDVGLVPRQAKAAFEIGIGR